MITKKYTPGPWKALKNHEYMDESGNGTYFDLDEDVDSEKLPFVRIGSPSKTIVSNHDLFSFSNKHDAELIELAPEMAETIADALNHLVSLKDESSAVYILQKMLEKINKE